MKVSSLSALLAGIVTLAIGASVLLRDRKQPAYRHFAILSFVICGWHFSQFVYASVPGDATYWLTLLPGVAVPLAAQRFFASFLAANPLRPPPIPRPYVLGTGALYGLLCYSAVLHRFHDSPMFAAALVAFVFGGLYACAYYVHRRSRKAATHTEQTRLRYLLIGGLVAITLALTDQLPSIGVPFPPVGTLATIIYMYFISQTLFRSRLLDLNELLGKMVVLSALMLILSIIFGLLVLWVDPKARLDQQFLNTVIASFVILILLDPLRLLVEERVNRWMFREKFELRRRTDALRRELSNIIEIVPMVRRVLAHLEESQRATHAAIYLLDAEGSGYDLAGHLGPRPEERLDAVTRRPLLERLRRDGVLLTETLQRQMRPDEEAAEAAEVIRALEEMHASVCFPLQADEHLLGMLCLRDERLREAYSSDEIDFFRALAAQMSVTLQNGQAYEQMRERARLAALGEMAAGLAHEIRNPLGAIKGAAQFLRPGGRDTPAPEGGPLPVNPQGVGEFLDIIVEETNRLNRVVSQFLDYARPDRGEREPLDVNEVLRRTVQLLEQQATNVQVDVHLADDLPQVKASAEQLRQVFLNLGLNALQAMPNGGRLHVSTRLRRGARRGEPASFLEVRFRDSGPGIPPRVQKNLFVPFFTTKEGGSGLGLAISQRIVHNHGGAIEVRSPEGHGATFTVLLPLSDEATRTFQPVGRESREAAASAREPSR